ncbi:protein BREAST CANCER SUSCEPTIBILITY 1 homolog isoform X1 [Ananas comosus]|uniref:RING-type E3 ubiquitin transferase BRCA1 n=1 Tax=Ananas comosus TaxID=4615 RepID=A0A6P5FG59_ANACO|nr:protein BREAST CANCER SUSCEPTIBILITY 1 homolog isoform X1 [Ananas comosus]
MGEKESYRRFLNPLVLNLQKMELELTCPICLKLLSVPSLLPCNHISCSLCVTAATINGCECPICKASFHYQDLRPAIQVEAIVNIYKSMNSTISAIFSQREPQIDIPDTKTPSGGSTDSGNKNDDDKFDEEQIHDILRMRSTYINSSEPTFGNVDCVKPNHYREFSELATNGSTKTDKVGNKSLMGKREPYSCPSSGELKDLFSDSNDMESEPRMKRSPFEGSLNKDLAGKNQLIEDQTRESKRQKMDSLAVFERDTDDTNCKDFLALNSKLTTEHERKPTDPKFGKSEGTNGTCMVECAFCHSFSSSEVSGPILHLLDGEPVTFDQASQVNVLNVHEKCIEWAPQAYFSGETVMNLEPELARASKIKCSSCGLKGAALGCYAKSCRRSFHLPCAYEIQGCRWDTDNFLMLCPTHSAHKLPCDRSKNKEKSKAKNPSSCSNLLHGDLTSSMKEQSNVFWTASSSMTREWILCGSALSSNDKEILDEFVGLTGIAAINYWKPNVTHVIAATDERGACSRTLKVLMAILGGKWVVSVNWLLACMEAGHPVPEEPYEISYDVHGSFDGPRTGRLRAMQKAPKLFEGLAFYFSGHFMPYYKSHLQDLITSAGGIILQKSELSHASLIVYSTEPPQGSDANDLNDVIRKRKEEAEELAVVASCRAVTHTWLLDSIAACNAQLPMLNS